MGDTCQCKHDKDIERLMNKVDTMEGEVGVRVSWTLFWSIVALLSSIVGTVITNIYSQIDDIEVSDAKFQESINDKVNDSKVNQAKIDTQLSQIASQLADIQTKLSKIK